MEYMTLAAVPSEVQPALLKEASGIFFATSITQNFETPAKRGAFYDRWFGRYASSEPEAFILALDRDGAVAGYVAGCTDSFAPLSAAIISDIPYYTPSFRTLVAACPSHFHINVKPGLQGRGIGRQLTGKFLDICRRTNSGGVHVVTGETSPAVTFYMSCGFERLLLPWENTARIAVLLRKLGW